MLPSFRDGPKDQTRKFEIPGSLAQRGIDASLDFVAWLATRNACGGLTKTCRGLIAARMINVATNFLARRRRISAVWADVCA
jgi:hypothetical protein